MKLHHDSKLQKIFTLYFQNETFNSEITLKTTRNEANLIESKTEIKNETSNSKSNGSPSSSRHETIFSLSCQYVDPLNESL